MCIAVRRRTAADQLRLCITAGIVFMRFLDHTGQSGFFRCAEKNFLTCITGFLMDMSTLLCKTCFIMNMVPDLRDRTDQLRLRIAVRRQTGDCFRIDIRIRSCLQDLYITGFIMCMRLHPTESSSFLGDRRQDQSICGTKHHHTS